jgi:hypothetical protein
VTSAACFFKAAGGATDDAAARFAKKFSMNCEPPRALAPAFFSLDGDAFAGDCFLLGEAPPFFLLGGDAGMRRCTCCGRGDP